MSVFKCKMCGGTLEINTGESVGTCEYCGTKQTLPKLDDDRKANMFDRANHFRRNNDYDKAASIYEQILNEDNTDAETYWSLVLCRYGIEYVEDPATHKRVPTVNRAQFTSIFDDADYKSAIQYADIYQKTIYEEEANAINEIQKGILAISQKEEPFDVFICYKETDNNGRRTQDSVLANDLYHQLTQEGFKVFFSRITLEDKLGTAYEPYIFAALNSAKVMVVLGTKPEHFNAVWVKNEWSRYLTLVKQSNGKKVLIPAYRDMDPYDLPDEFSHLQAQDMNKLGFMQDLIRGIKKIAQSDNEKSTEPVTAATLSAAVSINPLLKRAFMFLEDGEWERADDFCEQVLNLDPENAQAYLGKLMVELQVRHQEDLPNCEQPFDRSNYFQKAVRFGGDKFTSTLNGYIAQINERNENARIAGIYNDAVKIMNTARTEDMYKAAADSFKKILGFKDADALSEQCLERAEACHYNDAVKIMDTARTEVMYKAAADSFKEILGFKDANALYKQCLERAEVCRKDAIYSDARARMTGKEVNRYESAIRLFQMISGWKDADEQIYACRKTIEEIRSHNEAVRLELECKADAIAKAIKGLEIQQLKSDVRETLEAIKQLQEKKTSFGVFAGIAKRKIETIDKEIVALTAEREKIEESIKNYEDDLKEFSVEQEDELSYQQAINLYLTDIKVRTKFNAKYPELVKSLKTIKFGKYYQSTDNKKEPIEWIILEAKNSGLLLISKYALDCKLYNNVVGKKKTTWEQCTLRKWLNNIFIKDAFSVEEQKKIQNSIVLAHTNYKSENPGNNTTDKLFLLSIPEVEKYFGSEAERQCQGTKYCYAQGASKDDKGNCCWWLRSMGWTPYCAADVGHNGFIKTYGSYVNGEPEEILSGVFDDDKRTVRPAMWINLDA